VGVFLNGERDLVLWLDLRIENFFLSQKRKHFCLWQKQAFGLPTTLSVRSFQTSKNALGRSMGTLSPYPIRFLKKAEQKLLCAATPRVGVWGYCFSMS
jgi:hypothetical protein